MNITNKLACGSVIALILAAPIARADAGRTISPQEALADQGQNVTVEGIAHVAEADGMPGVFVHLGDRPPFVGYISTDNEAKFPDLRQLDGKKIAITGVVETNGAVPMIRLSSADQIKIVE